MPCHMGCIMLSIFGGSLPFIDHTSLLGFKVVIDWIISNEIERWAFIDLVVIIRSACVLLPPPSPSNKRESLYRFESSLKRSWSWSLLNLEWCLYFQHVVQSHPTTCSFRVLILPTNLTTYHPNMLHWNMMQRPIIIIDCVSPSFGRSVVGAQVRVQPWPTEERFGEWVSDIHSGFRKEGCRRVARSLATVHVVSHHTTFRSQKFRSTYSTGCQSFGTRFISRDHIRIRRGGAGRSHVRSHTATPTLTHRDTWGWHALTCNHAIIIDM